MPCPTHRCNSMPVIFTPALKFFMRNPLGNFSTEGSCSGDYVAWVQVVGCIVEHEGRILLCRRAIEPCKGLWTVPAGFLEMGESTAAGAARETWEEANARVEVHCN